MDRKIAFSILGITFVALAVAILMPGGRTVDKEPKLPWLIDIDAPGNLTVFKLTLDNSTLNDAREIFQSQGKANLFRSPEGDYAVEVYFQRLYLSGLRADIVLTMAIDDTLASEMFSRGLRISKMGSGTRKINLSDEDMTLLAEEKINLITYIPASNLEEELIQSRFGKPGMKLAEKGGPIVHWLYPEKGLDIAVNADGKEVFQYINPRGFDQVVAPLEQATTD